MTFALIVWLVMTVMPALITIKVALVIATVIGFLLTGFIAAITFDFPNGQVIKPWNTWKGFAKWTIPVVIALQFIPDTKTSWYMVGAYATQTVAQSDVAKELGQDSVDLMKSLIARAKQEIDDVDVKQLADNAVEQVKEGQK